MALKAVQLINIIIVIIIIIIIVLFLKKIYNILQLDCKIYKLPRIKTLKYKLEDCIYQAWLEDAQLIFLILH